MTKNLPLKHNPRKFLIPSFRVDLSDTDQYLSVCLDDLNLYFAGTFLFFEDENRWEKVKEFYDDRGIQIKSCWSTADINTRLEGRKIRFSFPQTGFYNFKKSVLDFRRKTHRQNKKGLCSTSGEVNNVSNLYEKYINFPTGFRLSQMWSWTPENVTTLFEKSGSLELENAYTEVSKLQSFARAVSPTFFLGQGITSLKPTLWFNHTLIGRVLTKKKIVVDDSLFLQEVLDFFLPQGIEVDATSA